MLGYDAQNQYRIYDPARNAVYVRRDVRFNEKVVGPPKPITNYDNSFHDKNTGDSAQIFSLLSRETKQLTTFTPVDENLTLHPTSSAAPANFTPIQTSLQNDGSSSTLLHVPAIAHNTANTETRYPAPTQGILVPETPPLVPTIPDRNQVPGTFEDSDKDPSDAPLSEKTMIVDMVRLVNLSVLEQIRLTTKNIFKKEKPVQPKRTHLSKLLLHIRKLVVSCLTTL